MSTPDQQPREVLVLVVGAGFAGIAMATALRQRGVHDFVVIERGADVGGTWRDNTYPGAACDVPSHLYSFSWALNPNWSRAFSPQPEIWQYMQDIARRQGVYEHCVFGAELIDAKWDADAARWRVATTQGDFVAQSLVSGAGALCEPANPDIAGLESFAGATFHSSRWNHDIDLTGKRVAVVGTGASAIQFVPEIADKVAHLDVYQRTAPWIIPRNDRAFRKSERWVFRHVPGAQRLMRTGIYWGRELFVLGLAKNPKLTRPAARIGRWHLDRQVEEPALRAKLRPRYTIGCKRILISNDWYPALQKPNVAVVTDAIDSVEPDAVLTSDGLRHEADVIVFATGFHVTDMPIAEHIRDDAGVSLAKHWETGAAAHRGTTVVGFPNLFFIVGPNTGLGHTSMIFMIEAQVNYIDKALQQMADNNLLAIEPQPAAQEKYNADVQRKLSRSVWNTGGCASWYLDAHGRNTSIWPDFTFRFRRETATFDLQEYRVAAWAGDGAGG
ncbi:MAG: flavin-containing monooxygenase [Jatrophihabitans sp.]